MNFQEADERYQELRKLLAAGAIKPAEYEKGAAQLRVLGEDGVWWAVHPKNGRWLRWDGKAWQEATPPHKHVEEVKCSSPKETILLDEKPPIGVILKGEEALRQLLEIRRICEETTPQGPRYVPVDLKPGGLLRGIAYKLYEDGNLDPKIAILYAAADSAEGKKMYIGGHWVIVPTENGAEAPQEQPTEKQIFASLLREMVDNLEVGYEVREKIKANLDLDQISLVDTLALPEKTNGWWQVEIPARSTAAREFQQAMDRLSKALGKEKNASARRRMLEEALIVCERGLEAIGDDIDHPLVAGIHTAMAAALVELSLQEKDEALRARNLHLAEDHAEMVEWLVQKGTTDLATVETLEWLVAARKKSMPLLQGVQALALARRLERVELTLAQICESYLGKKKQAMRDLFAARALENGSRLVDDKEEKYKILAVALWQAQAAQQLALKIGDATLVGQCQEILTLIEEEQTLVRGDYA